MQANHVIYHPSSYRDPSGFIFTKEGIVYRQVNLCFKDHFDHFIQSGCYDALVKKNLLIAHEVIPQNLTGSHDYHLTLKPERIGFISYPYEWSFDMLKDAALLTLQLAKESLAYGMMIKDATPYNIQWHKGSLVFIDTLSFEKYEETPWIAYRQFCENFLGPLLLMHYNRKQLTGLLLAWPDGIPLDIVSSMLPKRSRFSFYTYLHIHLHAKYSSKEAGNKRTVAVFSKQKLLNLLSSLESLVAKLHVPPQKSTWSDYYKEAAQRAGYLDQKKQIIADWAETIHGCTSAADLGANLGEFSGLLSSKKIPVLAADFDPYAINALYSQIKQSGEKYIQPLVLDLSNPTPAIGVNNQERADFMQRAGFDLLLALALIHHLAIGKNIPLPMIASALARMGKNLVIEFVPKEDEKIKLMLSRKKDIYTAYTVENFENVFSDYFSIIDKKTIQGSGRTLYLMQRHDA